MISIGSSTAYNRAYLASVLCAYAQILLRRTSDTLRTLGEIEKGEILIYPYQYQDF